MQDIEEVSSREFFDWIHYYSEYPFGPRRDNMHAAMIAMEILRPHLKNPPPIDTKAWWFDKPANTVQRRETINHKKRAIDFHDMLSRHVRH